MVVNANATANTLNIVGGNVGIGTTGPTSQLSIIKTGANTTFHLGPSESTGLDIFRENATGNIYYDVTESGASAIFRTNAVSNGSFQFLSGNVGIGTTGPTSLLTVQGRGEFQGTASASYLLTGNTIQVGGFASVSYNRFGTSTTGHSLSEEPAHLLLPAPYL
ncbi:MAG: hypothetical protein HYT67_00495 [Candidatus Yanofskybacteria bacterium]|nr:hypothetical protein [Candidatus Yanofskybacteria bacterium]